MAAVLTLSYLTKNGYLTKLNEHSKIYLNRKNILLKDRKNKIIRDLALSVCDIFKLSEELFLEASYILFNNISCLDSAI